MSTEDYTQDPEPLNAATTYTTPAESDELSSLKIADFLPRSSYIVPHGAQHHGTTPVQSRSASGRSRALLILISLGV